MGSQLLAIVDDDFRRAVEPPSAPPTRFFLNLTERCQLQCAHCITDAPARTRAGSALDMSADVVAALRPHLANAHWLGLVHAGEPMLAPAFAPALRALPAHAVVHLLTNGMAMTPTRFTEVVALGVRSLSFSLDGMSSQTNDVLRIGSRVPVLLERIATVARLARETPAARRPRIGISWVVTKANVTELPALVRFAAEAQLDWLKLEEPFAVNEVAAALSLDRYALDVAVADAREQGKTLGVAVLDHTRPLAVWRCRLDLDARMATRARLDDLVNRVELNPCRAPWEVVCVEPNGDVRPLSFHHPVAGNALVTPLDQLFRGEVFAAARATTRATRLCGAGPTTCASDPGPQSW